MKSHRSRFRSNLIVGTVTAGVLALLILPAQGVRSNCGGNSAALAQVHTIEILAELGAYESPDGRFRYAAAKSPEKEQLSACSRSSWIPQARFLVTLETLADGFIQSKKPKRIIVVCDTPFDNVPRRRFFPDAPTHAVAYSDGTTGRISTSEFAALDRTKFKRLDELYPETDPVPPAESTSPPSVLSVNSVDRPIRRP